MRALVFGVEPEGDGSDLPEGTSEQLVNLARTPMALRELPDPGLLAPDWVVVKTRLTGICGSDAKQVFLDGDADSAMSALISFPQVLGHELVGDIVEVGPDSGRRVGERVVLNSWLSCAPRGICPPCPSCSAGDFAMCHNFLAGHLPPGIHTGNSSVATGGFADLVPAHTSMAIPVPDGLDDESAVLADPFSVALHSVLRNPPPPGARVLVYGIGALGLATLACLRLLHPDVTVAAAARWPFQAALAQKYGAVAFDATDPADLIAAVADWAAAPLLRPWLGLAWTNPGGVDVVYDTVASPQTLEVGVRVARQRGALVLTGVGNPARWEWTPWYFKELTLRGSNAFGMETVRGVRRHAIAHYLELAAAGEVDLRPMLTHRFALTDWRAAFDTIARQGETGAAKVAFDFR
ncbi:MAG: zinc-dependent alcohol dehydrogenase [Mycobacteriales bacterium]